MPRLLNHLLAASCWVAQSVMTAVRWAAVPTSETVLTPGWGIWSVWVCPTVSFPLPGMLSVAQGPCPRGLCAGLCPARLGLLQGSGSCPLFTRGRAGSLLLLPLFGECRRGYSPSFVGPGLKPTVNVPFPTAEAGAWFSVLSL